MTTILDEYLRQRSDLVEASKTPAGVVFSHIGYDNALKEESKHGRTHNTTQGAAATYCGLPRWIDPNLKSDIVVTHLCQEEWFEQQRNVRRSRQSAVTVKIDGIMGGAPVVEIVAANLKAPQLCDIIRAWLDSDDATHWGDFEKALDAAVVQHGLFE